MALTKVTGSGADGLTLSSTDVTVTSGDLLFGTSAKGVNLGVTSNTDSNTLDDYEEGTWTPSIIGAGGQSGQAYQTQQGGYTKIGNLVLCRFNLKLSSEGSFSGSYLLLSGLPFTLLGTPITVNLGDLYFVTLAANYISLNLQGYESTNTAFIWAKKSATTSREYLGTADLTDTSQLTGAFCYASNV